MAEFSCPGRLAWFVTKQANIFKKIFCDFMKSDRTACCVPVKEIVLYLSIAPSSMSVAIDVGSKKIPQIKKKIEAERYQFDGTTLSTILN